jgi:Acetyl xylan esterase (AXE1)
MRIAIATVLLGAMVASAAEPLPKTIAPYFAPPTEFAGKLGSYRSPLRFADGSEAKTAEDWKRRRQEILKNWTDLLGSWPDPVLKPKVELLDAVKHDGFIRQHVRIEIAPGRTTEDCYLLIPDGKGPFPGVVVVFYDGLTGVGEGKGKLRDFALQLAKRGFVALSLGSAPETYYPDKERCKLQPLSFHAYEASTCRNALANMPQVDGSRIGVVVHSYGGKWAMFAGALDEKFAAVACSDPGIVFDEKRSNVNYWEPWYLGFEPGKARKPGIPTDANPRTGPYKQMIERGMDLHEIHALIAPRPFLVSGGSEDLAERWIALNRTVAVNKLLGFENRVGMTTRKTHDPTDESNEVLYTFFEHFLKAK